MGRLLLYAGWCNVSKMHKEAGLKQDEEVEQRPREEVKEIPLIVDI